MWIQLEQELELIAINAYIKMKENLKTSCQKIRKRRAKKLQRKF